MKQYKDESNKELASLCNSVRTLVKKHDYEKCKAQILVAMQHYPHAPHPHNLLGIVLEKEHFHLQAMKHFRAARALDSTYQPARHNLEHYGTFFSKGRCAFDESDCEVNAKEVTYSIFYDNHGIGHVTKEEKNESF